MNEEAKKNIQPEEIEATEEALNNVSGGLSGGDNIFLATCSNCGKQYATGRLGACPYCGAERNQQEADN